jgi:NADH dehydrogenase
MMQLATIFGGSGFVGRYIAQRMARAGWRVRVACRRPDEALFVRAYGPTGQVEPVLANIRHEGSVREVVRGAHAVVNCVGILAEAGPNRFDPVQAKGAETVARAAAEVGARALVQISAIGADPDSASDYARTKGEGERLVRGAFPGAVLLRPSIVFGPEDQFFNRFASMARFTPVLPIVGGATRFQPVYVDDVAEAAALAATGRAGPGVYELGGPDVDTFRELMQVMLGIIRRRRLVMSTPFPIARAMGWTFDGINRLAFGLTPRPLTLDQVRNLAVDNVATGDHPGFDALGIAPASMEAVLPEYLWRFRPAGQYAVLREGAERLREAGRTERP